jgi:transposase
MKAAVEAKVQPKGRDGRRKRDARARSPERVFNAQRPRREAEASARREAVKVARWASSNGDELDEVAKAIGVSPRTLRHWRSGWRRARLAPRMRGRRAERLDLRTRENILEVLKLMGPKVGVAVLRPNFPDVSRSALKSMLARFRDVRYYFEGKRAWSLEWTRPGAVWAVDHKERRASPVDGRYPFALANRDLGSNEQLDWTPVESKDAATTDLVLEARYREHGAPLVQKADGGFAAKSTRSLLQRWGVFLLLSPPHLPRYNGSIEAGICSMIARTDHHAASSGRPGEWSCEDLEAARLEANETGRPWGSHGPTPDEAWNDRRSVSAEERRAFEGAVRKHAHWWRKVVVGSKQREEVTQADEDAVTRYAVTAALKDLGYLKAGRGRNISTTFPQKSGKHI